MLDVCVHAVAESFADTRALLNVAVTLIERLSAQRSDTTATPVAVLTVQRALRRLGSYKRVWAALQSAQLGVPAAERPHAPMTGAAPTDEQLPAGWVWQAFREADLEQLIRDLLAAKHTNAAFVIWARHHDGACRRGKLAICERQSDRTGHSLDDGAGRRGRGPAAGDQPAHIAGRAAHGRARGDLRGMDRHPRHPRPRRLRELVRIIAPPSGTWRQVLTLIRCVPHGRTLALGWPFGTGWRHAFTPSKFTSAGRTGHAAWCRSWTCC